ncbi:MAG: carboxypeptidase regulatory-like domain-containing protein [Acidobacteriota bacterium]|nr:carboxypeptidase regulatory-like domain-containing protein [Acidobacteriota bacterium]
MRFVKVYLLIFCAFAGTVAAQSGSVRGRVTDETYAIIPGAAVTAQDSSGNIFQSVATSDGTYVLRNLPYGTYSLEAKAPGFEIKKPITLTVMGVPQTLNLVLFVAAVKQQLTVEADAQGSVSVEPSGNAGALVLSGSDLNALADNPDDLASDLQALAGPAAGPSGGSFYIDGFSTGVMPPKDSIREIRVNQNPFSVEYDKLGLGRIEILTKPGYDKFHGSESFNLGGAFWNSRNPYASVKAPFLLREYGSTIGGPLNRRASYTLDWRFEDTTNGAVINGSTLDPSTFGIIDPSTTVFSVPQLQGFITPRLDYQLNATNTLTARYRYSRSDIADSGLGSFSLPESAYHAISSDQTVQATETAVLGQSTVNETRFQYFTVQSISTPLNSGPSIQVSSAFTGGGSTVGNSSDNQKNVELQNITTITRGKQNWRFGGRLRTFSDQNVSQQNFNGTFTFSGGTGPQLDSNNQPVLGSTGSQLIVPVTSIEQYRRTLIFEKQGLSDAQIRALGAGPNQFNVSAGNPQIQASQVDAALFAGDDWKVRPNLTLSAGIRYELQNNISDAWDFAPRVAVAWAPARFQQKLVLRGGSGIFYDRFALGSILSSLRYNGVTQQQYVIRNPSFFPVIPTASFLAASKAPNSIQTIQPDIRSPFLIQTVLSAERQLPAHTVVAVSYTNTHGLHQLRSLALNAPLPAGTYPLGNSNPVFAVASSARYNQNQLIANVNANVRATISLFGSYTFNRAFSNSDGAGTFAANPYSMTGEYGPAGTDIHHIETFGGTFTAPWKTTLSPLLTVRSGAPFNLTVGRDVYGTTIFNARPGIANNPTKAGLIATSYGLLDPNPTSDETILPRNYGRGPGSIQLNLRVGQTILLGRTHEANSASGGTKPRYTLVVTMQIRNILNHNNPGPIIGDIASPLFGRANQAAGSAAQSGANFSEAANNRRLELQTRFTF